MFLAQRSAYELVLEFFLPVEADGARDMALFIGGVVYVNFDEADLWIIEMGLYPICVN